MTLTNGEAYEIVTVLSACKEKGKLGYAIAKNLRKIKTEITEYAKMREDLLREYGTPIPQTTQYQLYGENLDKFRDELDTVANEQIEVDVYQIDEDLFISGTLTSDQMSVLLFMVKGE